MNRFIYKIYRRIMERSFSYCTAYLLTLPEQEKLTLLNEEEQIDLQCQKIRSKNCKHEPMIVCKICGQIYNIEKDKKK